MHFGKEYKNGMREIEIDLCFQRDNVALPFFISWWKQKFHKAYFAKKQQSLKNVFWLDINVHVLCFSLHFTWWKWGK